MNWINSFIDIVAVKVSIWGLRRLFGADCETDVRNDFPEGYVELYCLSCDAKRIINSLIKE